MPRQPGTATASGGGQDALTASLSAITTRIKNNAANIHHLEQQLTLATALRGELNNEREVLLQQCVDAGVSVDPVVSADLGLGVNRDHTPPSTVLSWSSGSATPAPTSVTSSGAPPDSSTAAEAQSLGHPAATHMPPSLAASTLYSSAQSVDQGGGDGHQFGLPPMEGLMPPFGDLSSLDQASWGMSQPGSLMHAPPGLGQQGLPAQLAPMNMGGDAHSASQVYVPTPITTTVATLSQGVWNRVMVCHVEDGNFWVHEDQQSEQLAEIEIAMAEVYRNAGNTATVNNDQVNIGAWFGALYASDEDELDQPTWTRAIVLATSDGGGPITITHADYGSTATVDISELRLLKPEFLSLSAQAIRCELNGTGEYKSAADPTAERLTDILSGLLDFGAFFCAVVKVPENDHPYVVNVFNEAGDDMLAKVHEQMMSTQPVAAVEAPHPPQPAAPPPTKVVAAPTAATVAQSAQKPHAPAPSQKPAPKSTGSAWGGSKNDRVLSAPTQGQKDEMKRQAAAADADGWVEVKKPPSKPPAAAVPARTPLAPGFVFHCAPSTVQECLDRQLFGLPRKFIDSMRAIRPAINGEQVPTELFLFNGPKNLLFGPFEAVSECGLDLDPEAWKVAMKRQGRGGSPFPAQVRVRWKGQQNSVTMPSKINIGMVNPKIASMFISKLEGK